MTPCAAATLAAAVIATTPAADDWGQLRDERGSRPGSDEVWTGTTSGGRKSADTCLDWRWTSSADPFNVREGLVGHHGSSSAWTWLVAVRCSTDRNRLYCFEQ